MKYLGIDYGTKRIGLAVADDALGMAFPRDALVKQNNEQMFEVLARVIDEEGIEAIVLGLPLGLEGQDTLTTRQVRNFAKKIKSRFGLPVSFADERLSSAEAEERLIASGVRGKKLKQRLDSQAAVLILETHLSL